MASASNISNMVESLLEKPFSRRDFEEKNQIKNDGKPTPEMKKMTSKGKTSNRGFNIDWYRKEQWLTGSESTNKLYCWPCLLFPVSGNEVWQEKGFNDLKNLPRALDRHKKCKDHILAVVKLELLGKTRIDYSLNEAKRTSDLRHNEKVKKNRDVMKKLIDITTLLARQELPFRGHDESEVSENKGNYLEMIDLLSKSDETLRVFMENSTTFSGTSKTIQNDLIESVAHIIRNEINADIENAQFFSWQIDEATDISSHAQVSIIVRFVKDGVPVERFLGFFDVSSDRCATSLKELLDRELERFSYKEKLVAQTYDGAAVMASELNGLQAKVKCDAPQALFVHCYAHRLNLVLSRAASVLKESRIFCANLNAICAFFSKSTKRVHLLESVGGPRPPRVSQTRWNFKSRSVSTIADHRCLLIEVFEKIEDDSNYDDETIHEAAGLKRWLQDFNFVFLLFSYKKIFDLTEVTFSVLQSNSSDVTFCNKRITGLCEKLLYFRDQRQFDDLYHNVCSEVGSPNKRFKGSNDIPATVQYRRLYYEVIDNVTTQLKCRFSDIEKLKFLQLVDVHCFEAHSRIFPEHCFKALLQTYEKYFDSTKLHSELQVLYSDRDLWNNAKSTTELLSAIYNNNLAQALPELFRLLSLVVTIPATSASVERSFSCLKRIKKLQEKLH